jgi:RNA-directed DNA polymerase
MSSRRRGCSGGPLTDTTAPTMATSTPPSWVLSFSMIVYTPSRASVRALLRTVREVVRKHEAVPASVLVMKLNPVIRGWALYHWPVVSSQRFAYVNHHIWNALWRWAGRRHPTKGCLWVRRKYFPPHGTRTWVFTGVHRSRDGTREPLRIFYAADVHIRRHVVISGDANPFDPTWDSYFQKRRRSSSVEPRPRRRALAEA